MRFLDETSSVCIEVTCGLLQQLSPLKLLHAIEIISR